MARFVPNPASINPNTSIADLYDPNGLQQQISNTILKKETYFQALQVFATDTGAGQRPYFQDSSKFITVEIGTTWQDDSSNLASPISVGQIWMINQQGQNLAEALEIQGITTDDPGPSNIAQPASDVLVALLNMEIGWTGQPGGNSQAYMIALEVMATIATPSGSIEVTSVLYFPTWNSNNFA